LKKQTDSRQQSRFSGTVLSNQKSDRQHLQGCGLCKTPKAGQLYLEHARRSIWWNTNARFHNTVVGSLTEVHLIGFENGRASTSRIRGRSGSSNGPLMTAAVRRANPKDWANRFDSSPQSRRGRIYRRGEPGFFSATAPFPSGKANHAELAYPSPSQWEGKSGPASSDVASWRLEFSDGSLAA